MDKLSIKNLQIYAFHGVYEEEKQKGQNFYVSVDLYFNTLQAGKYGELSQSVNYAQLSQDIKKFMLENRYDLIESVAHYLSIYILGYHKSIKKINLTISKPEAPIGIPVENLSVTIKRGWTKAYVAYGSNIGDKQAYIKMAGDKIKENPMIRNYRQSDTIITKPYGGVEQEDFYNGCVEMETILQPEELLAFLNKVEQDAGRTRDIHWGPRTLDLDIILYGNEIIQSENLIIPHYDMQNRLFVLEPLCQLNPHLIHPVYHTYIMDLLKKIK